MEFRLCAIKGFSRSRIYEFKAAVNRAGVKYNSG